jgi:hypothetical protein
MTALDLLPEAAAQRQELQRGPPQRHPRAVRPRQPPVQLLALDRHGASIVDGEGIAVAHVPLQQGSDLVELGGAAEHRAARP